MIIFMTISFMIFKIDTDKGLLQIKLTSFGFLFLFAARIIEYKFFKIYRAKGFNQVNVVLIADDSSEQFIKSLISRKEWGYRITAIFTSSVRLYIKYKRTIMMLPETDLSVLTSLMESRIVDEVLYLKRRALPSEIREVAGSCEELGVVFRLRYDDKNINLTSAIKTNISNTAFLNFINTPNTPYSLAFKKILDINISLFMLISLSWVFLIISALIKLTSPGPVIYRQARVGLRGRQFNLYKFRTMVDNAEAL